MDTPRTLLIACGALAREVAALTRANGWTSFDVRCLPAELHNRPEKIAPAVRAEIHAQRAHYAQMFVVYGDCGTGGMLDAVLKEEGVERLPGRALLRVLRHAAGVCAADRRPSWAPSTSPTSCCAISSAWWCGRSGSTAIRSCARNTSATTGSSSTSPRWNPPAPSSARAQIADSFGLRVRVPPHRLRGPRQPPGYPRRAAPRSANGQPDHHLLARHPGAGRRQARPRDRQGATAASASRRRSTARRCAPARAAPMPTSPTGSAAIRFPAARTCKAEAAAAAARLEARFTDEQLEALIRAKGLLAPA